jgi:hypothetical protein
MIFLFRFRKEPTEIFEMLKQEFDEEVMYRAQLNSFPTKGKKLSLTADLVVQQYQSRTKKSKSENYNYDAQWSTSCCQNDFRRTEYQ